MRGYHRKPGWAVRFYLWFTNKFPPLRDEDWWEHNR